MYVPQVTLLWIQCAQKRIYRTVVQRFFARIKLYRRHHCRGNRTQVRGLPGPSIRA